MEVFVLKGYGKSINYHMGIPLLRDVVQSMEQAIIAKEGSVNFDTLNLSFILIRLMLTVSLLLF